MHVELLRDHVLGTLYGLAIGDALGSQFQGRSASEIQMRYGPAPLRMESNDKLGLRAGDWTDGAGQAFAIMDSFSSCCGFEGIDCAGQLLDWYELNPKGAGYFSRDVLRELSHDPEKWQTAGRDIWIRGGGVPAGCGALPRCIIAGIFYRDDIEKMVETTIQLCQITHFDPRCVESALVLNYVVMQLLHKRYSDNIAEDAAVFLRATRNMPLYNNLVHKYRAEELLEYSNFSPFPRYDGDHDAVPQALAEIPRLKYEKLHNSGKSSHTLQVALWCLLNTTSYEQAISKAVRLGGEAATNGAVTGALAGARFGFSRLPSEWVTQVKNSRHIVSRGEVLLSRAQKLEEQEFREGRRQPMQQPPRTL